MTCDQYNSDEAKVQVINKMQTIQNQDATETNDNTKCRTKIKDIINNIYVY